MDVAFVLHAHLPYVRAERPWTAEERWYHDALWTCYLPLLEVIDEGPITLSMSPPLIEMLRDPVMASRFEAHLDALDAVNEAYRDTYGEAAAFYARRIAGARTRWLHHRADVIGRLKAHWQKGSLELWTTAVTHAFLPGLAVVAGAAEAQVRLGRDVFEDAFGAPPDGFWLPECGVDARVAAAVVRACGPDVRCVVDAHATMGPARSPEGLVMLPRHIMASHRVWSRADGYPRNALYREFHLDLGHRSDQLGPFAAGTMTGLKYHRITGATGDKAPYRPRDAEVQAKRDAADFVRWLAEQPGDALVAAYDAELFGHWWFEGPVFLREVLAGIASHPRLRLVTMAQLETLNTATPRASSWGRGGDAAVWIGPATARLWRHIHGTARQLMAAVAQHDPDDEGSFHALALDEALRQGLQLQASDWAFAIEDGSAADYALGRIRRHRRGVRRWLARGERPVRQDGGFLQRRTGEALKGAFRPVGRDVY